MSTQQAANLCFDGHWCGRLCTDAAHLLGETDSSLRSQLGRWELRRYAHSLRCYSIVVRTPRCEASRRGGENLNFLLQELEDILDHEGGPVAAHTMGVQQESTAEVDTGQVEHIDSLVVLDQRPVPEAGHEHHTAVVVALCLHHLDRRLQMQAQRSFGTRQDGIDTPG